MDPIRALKASGGAARREALLLAGVSRRALIAALNGGEVLRPYRGCYALPGTPSEHMLAAMLRATVTCVSVFGAWGVPLVGKRDPRIHLGVPRDRGVTARDPRWQAGVVLHRGPQLTGARPLDAVIALQHASRCLDFAPLLVACDHLLRTGAVDHRALDSIPGAAGKRLRALASQHSDSPPETLARLALIEAGYAPQQQVWFSDVGRVDLVVEGSVVVEVDGRSYHSDPVAFVRDRQRDRELNVLGYRVLRFAAVEVLTDRAVVARGVREVVGAPRGKRLMITNLRR